MKVFDETLRVIIVENSDTDRHLLENMLGKACYGDFEVFSATSLKEADTLLAKEECRVAILDLDLDDSSGIQTLETFSKKHEHIAIVVNTGAYQEDLGLRAVSLGAQDYLIKGMYKPYGLAKSLYYAVERKRAELELKDAQAHLIRAEKMNIIGSVASGIAHEVKNPLATILYGVEFLESRLQEKDDKVVLTLTSMKDATMKANEIIKDLLDFASLSELVKSEIDIHEIIQRALNLTYHQLEKCFIKVATDYENAAPKIEVDANRIEQVVVDVILNAINAMKKNGVLTIRTQLKKFAENDMQRIDPAIFIKPGTDVLIVDFEDTGPGISKDIQEKVFDPFFTTRRASGGVGLGLSIARTIMVNHGGGIDLVNLKNGSGARSRLIFVLESTYV